jgi:hypothetical protein
MERKIPGRAKWEITLCPAGKIHVHYQTGSPDVLRGGYLRLAGAPRCCRSDGRSVRTQKRPESPPLSSRAFACLPEGLDPGRRNRWPRPVIRGNGGILVHRSY